MDVAKEQGISEMACCSPFCSAKTLLLTYSGLVWQVVVRLGEEALGIVNLKLGL